MLNTVEVTGGEYTFVIHDLKLSSSLTYFCISKYEVEKFATQRRINSVLEVAGKKSLAVPSRQ